MSKLMQILLERYLDGDLSILRADNPKNWSIGLMVLPKNLDPNILYVGDIVCCTKRELRKHPDIFKRLIAKDGC